MLMTHLRVFLGVVQKHNFITLFSDLDETGFLFCVENTVSCSAPQLWRGGFTSSSN